MDLFSRTCLDLGSSFILIKGLIGLSALQVGSYGLFLLLFLLLIGFRSLSKIPKEKWKFAMTSMFGTLSLLFAIAQTEIDSSVTSILNS
jgi:hypothetical protein